MKHQHDDRVIGSKEHPRTLGWIGTGALAMGGSNQSLFLIGALFIGQANIPGQGSAAVPLLILGLLLSWAAAPAWTELVLMSKNRVGGIAASCTEAFRPYSSVLSALTGVCYWWGWVPTCGLTALLSASAIQQWMLPGVPVPAIACALVAFFAVINLCGIKWVTTLAVPIATASAVLAFLAVLTPVLTGHVDWRQATNFTLTTPFSGWFGGLTSIMAGLYLVGFAAPAFEAATCHVGETASPERNVPRAMLASGAMAGLYFVVIPLVWLGALGAAPLGGDLAVSLGPVYAPVFGSLAKAVAIGFMMFNMFHGTLQPLAGASRTLSQLSEDGLLPRFLALRSSTDCPWAATLLTAAVSIAFLLIGDPIWLIAAANFTYLISICMPNIAAWLLRRDAPEAARPYRAPRGAVTLGLVASAVWLLSAVLGFQQFGLPTVLFGLAMAYSGAGFYACRKIEDRLRQGLPALAQTLHLTLTGAMLLVLVLDGAGYLIAIRSLPGQDGPMVTALADIFVVVAVLTLAVGLVLPGVIAHSATEISDKARLLTSGMLRDFSQAMIALGRGDLEAAHTEVNLLPVGVKSRDELGQMAVSFNLLQEEVATAARGLDNAREGLRTNRTRLLTTNEALSQQIREGRLLNDQLLIAKDEADAANAAKGQFLANMSHEIRTPMHGVLGMTEILMNSELDARQQRLAGILHRSGQTLLEVIDQILDISKLESGKLQIERVDFDLRSLVDDALDLFSEPAAKKGLRLSAELPDSLSLWVHSDPTRIRQVLSNLLSNAIKFTQQGEVIVRFAIASEAEDRLTANIEISDTGIGISEAAQQSVFSSFTQADETTTRKFGGTGLGLAIVKQLLAMLGGDITLESEPGKGSSFCVTLPLAKAVAPEAAPESALGFGLSGGLALVVGGDQKDRRSIRQPLERWGLTVVEAADGAEALAVHSGRHRKGARFSVAVLDSQLGDMGALALAERLRDQNEQIKVILAGPTGGPIEADGLAKLGIVDWLQKPIRHSQLYNAICVSQGRVSAIELAAPKAARRATGFRILLVEDNQVNQEVARETLSFLGHSYDLAATGADAINLFGKGRYDLILMDCHLPDIDGFDTTKAIRSAEAASGTTRTPIIALTADALTEDRARCLACGMDDHLGKPFTRSLFAAMLEKWISPAADSADVAGWPTSKAEPADAPVTVAGKLVKGPLDQIRDLQRPGQPSVLAAVIGAFNQSVPKLLAALDEGLARGDAAAIRKHAHTIKSASANLGAMALSQSCRELEANASQGTLDGMASLLSRIRDDYNAASSGLRECLAADAVIPGAVGHG